MKAASLLKAFGAAILSLPAASAFASMPAVVEMKPVLDATGLKITLAESRHSSRLIVCILKSRALKTQMSFDGSAVILSDLEFVSTTALQECGERPLVVNKISPAVGSLVDVNFSKGLYLALDPISVSPLSFLATVGRIGSSKNLVNLPGAYMAGVGVERLQEQGFSFNEGVDRPRISPSGLYVSPGGAPDCSTNAYPGVWDLKRNKRVILPGERQEHHAECEALFE